MGLASLPPILVLAKLNLLRIEQYGEYEAGAPCSLNWLRSFFLLGNVLLIFAGDSQTLDSVGIDPRRSDQKPLQSLLSLGPK